MQHYGIAKAIGAGARLGWRLTESFVNRTNQPTPKWAPSGSPPSGLPPTVPRKTESLCPACIGDAVCGVETEPAKSASVLKQGIGIVKAEIVDEAGRVLMRKICDHHGPFEDLLATDSAFFRRMESLYRGRDFTCADDEGVHDHGVSSIKYGRGSFLVVDLTNRCNMRCTPCFMNANGVGYVHELPFEDMQAILRRALSFKPRREVNVFFSGGEPTLYPQFLEAVRYAKQLGFHRLHVATNGLRFAQEPDFAIAARDAGLHSVFLQLDGVSEAKNRRRGVGNLFEAKIQAIENIHRAGLRVNLQVTVINGVNEDQAGPILDFVIRNGDKIFGVLFQPIMFAGRDRLVEDQRRYRQRYTLSQLATDLQAQSSADWRPLRDWFPMSIFHEFANLVDLLRGADADLGSVACNHHPDSGVVSPLVVDQQTKAWVPLASFFDLEGFLKDIGVIRKAGRAGLSAQVRLRLSVLRNFSAELAPAGFGYRDLFDLFEQCLARINSSSERWRERELESGRWRVLLVKGLWLQDLYNFDFRNVEMSTTPVATQNGEISFCAYNAAGWREVVEAKHQTARLAEWRRQHGPHEVFANGQMVQLRPNSSEAEPETVRLSE